MQWLSIDGDLKSRLSEILRQSGKQFIGVSAILLGGVSIVNEIAPRVKESSLVGPCLPGTPCGETSSDTWHQNCLGGTLRAFVEALPSGFFSLFLLDPFFLPILSIALSFSCFKLIEH